VTEPDSWSALFEAVPRAQRAAARVLGSRDDAEDCVSAALEAALTTDNIDDPGAWLTQVARRRAVDIVRRRERESRAMYLVHSRESASCSDFTEDIADREAARWLATEAERLPGDTRKVLTRMGGEDSAAEVGSELGLSTRSVESHLRRARVELRTAWGRAMLGLAGLGYLIRRFSTVTQPAVIGSTLAAFVAASLVVGGAPAEGSMRPAGTPQNRPIATHVHLLARPALVRRGSVTAKWRFSAPTRSASMPSAAAKPVAGASLPVGSAKVSEQHRPGPDDPVGSTTYCLEHWRVTTTHIGC